MKVAKCKESKFKPIAVVLTIDTEREMNTIRACFEHIGDDSYMVAGLTEEEASNAAMLMDTLWKMLMELDDEENG